MKPGTLYKCRSLQRIYETKQQSIKLPSMFETPFILLIFAALVIASMAMNVPHLITCICFLLRKKEIQHSNPIHLHSKYNFLNYYLSSIGLLIILEIICINMNFLPQKSRPFSTSYCADKGISTPILSTTFHQ